CYYIFFFSSRRRHTRFSRDWSSDVCSSDLPRPAPEALMRILVAEDEPRISRFIARGLTASGYTPTVVDDGIAALDHASSGEFDRSEERRVGKECRSGWSR